MEIGTNFCLSSRKYDLTVREFDTDSEIGYELRINFNLWLEKKWHFLCFNQNIPLFWGMCEERSIEKIKINSCENNTLEAGNLNISANSFDVALQKTWSVQLDQVIRHPLQLIARLLVAKNRKKGIFSILFGELKGLTLIFLQKASIDLFRSLWGCSWANFSYTNLKNWRERLKRRT
jgi:hypothetical protein